MDFVVVQQFTVDKVRSERVVGVYTLFYEKKKSSISGRLFCTSESEIIR